MNGTARPRRSGEPWGKKRADELTMQADFGRIVFHPGNRGYLRYVERETNGVYVCTTTGVAVYPFDAEFSVWGSAAEDAGTSWVTASGDRLEVFPQGQMPGPDGWSGWYWRLRSRKGQIVATGGESYTRKHSAVRAARRRHPEVTK